MIATAIRYAPVVGERCVAGKSPLTKRDVLLVHSPGFREI
jgi:hypothetical protein